MSVPPNIYLRCREAVSTGGGGPHQQVDEEAQAQLALQERRLFLLHVSAQLPVIQVTMKLCSAIIIHS